MKYRFKYNEQNLKLNMKRRKALEERYRHLNKYLIEKFGERTLKICVDGHFTCPNRDGTLSNNGCIFCSECGSGELIKDSEKDITTQMKRYFESYRAKRANKFIVYFQNFTNTYDTIENLQPTEGKFLVTKDEKQGVIDLKGNELVEIEYDQILSDGYYTEQDGYKKSGFLVSYKTEDGFRYGYINYTGKKFLDTKYHVIERIAKEDDKNLYLIVSENGQYGLYQNTKKVIENEYQSIAYEEDIDVIILQKNKKYGVATLAGEIIIPVENDEIVARGIYLYAQAGNDKKVYDTQGNTVEINYNRSIYKTENEEYKISTILNNNITYYGITDKNYNQLVDENYRYIEYLYENYFIATDENGNLGVINSNGRVILEMKYSSKKKIKGKKILQAVETETGMSEFYSATMEKVVSGENANILTQDEYVIITMGEEKIYLDNAGNKIEDTTQLQDTAFPDEIGEYKKEQITIENVYYIKNSQ